MVSRQEFESPMKESGSQRLHQLEHKGSQSWWGHYQCPRILCAPYCRLTKAKASISFFRLKPLQGSPLPQKYIVTPSSLWTAHSLGLLPFKDLFTHLLFSLDCLPLAFEKNDLAFNNPQVRYPMWLPSLPRGEFPSFLLSSVSSTLPCWSGLSFTSPCHWKEACPLHHGSAFPALHLRTQQNSSLDC